MKWTLFAKIFTALLLVALLPLLISALFLGRGRPCLQIHAERPRGKQTGQHGSRAGPKPAPPFEANRQGINLLEFCP